MGKQIHEIQNVERPSENLLLAEINWLFSDTVEGAKASAILYSLLVTAKINNINPNKALEYLLTRIPRTQTIEDYERLTDIIVGLRDIPCT